MRISIEMMSEANSCILGIGNDILEIQRMRKSIKTHGERFISRLFTIKERNYCLKHKDAAMRFAARFVAKEAVAKALGTGFGKDVSPLDIEILNDAQGKPCVHPSPSLKKKMKNSYLLVSISHCKLYASAVAIWVRSA